MSSVTIYAQNEIPDALLAFAVIICRHQGQYVYCKHKQRTTYEVPGGHREPGETIEQTAHRELFEETGAIAYKISPLFSYGVLQNKIETYGMLFYAEIEKLGSLPKSEIGSIHFFDGLPTALTYPDIQPILLYEAQKIYNI